MCLSLTFRYLLLLDVNVSPGGGIRGNGLLFQGGELLLNGKTFNPKPVKAVSIVLWVKVRVTEKKHTLFSVIGTDDPIQVQFYLDCSFNVEIFHTPRKNFFFDPLFQNSEKFFFDWRVFFCDQHFAQTVVIDRE